MPSRDTRFQPGAASTALAIVFLFLCLYALIAMFYLAGMTERDIGHVFKGLKRLFREGGAVTWAVAFFHVVAMGALGGLGFLSIRGKRIPSAALLLPALAPFLAGVLGTALDLIKVHQALGFADGEHRAVMLAQGFSESLVPAQLGAMSSGMVALGVMTAGAFGLAGLHLPAMATRRAGALGAAAGAGVILIASCIAIRAALGLRPDAGDVAAWGGLISAAFCGGIASLALASIAEHTDPDAAGTIWRKGGMMAAAGGLGLALLGLSDLLDAQRQAFGAIGGVEPDTLALVVTKAAAEIQSIRLVAATQAILGGAVLAVPLLFSGPALPAGLRGLGPSFWLTLAGIGVVLGGVVFAQVQFDQSGPAMLKAAATEARRGSPTCETKIVGAVKGRGRAMNDTFDEDEVFLEKKDGGGGYRPLEPDALPTDRARCGRVTIRSNPDDARITVTQRRYRTDCTQATEEALESCVRGRPDYSTLFEERTLDNPTLHLDRTRGETVRELTLELPVRETTEDRRVVDRLEYLIQVDREGYVPRTWYLPAEENRKAAEPMEDASWTPSSRWPDRDRDRKVDWLEANLKRIELPIDPEGLKAAYREARLQMACAMRTIERNRRAGMPVYPDAEAFARDEILGRYGCASLDSFHDAVAPLEADLAFKASVEQSLKTVPCPEYPPRGFPICEGGLGLDRRPKPPGLLGVLRTRDAEEDRIVSSKGGTERPVAKTSLGTGSTTGFCDGDAVRRAIRMRLAGLRYCYESRLQVSPKLSGKFTLRWTIGLQGDVLNAAIVDDTLGDPAVGQCLLRQVRRIRFPKPEGGICVVSFPFVFTGGQ